VIDAKNFGNISEGSRVTIQSRFWRALSLIPADVLANQNHRSTLNPGLTRGHETSLFTSPGRTRKTGETGAIHNTLSYSRLYYLTVEYDDAILIFYS
jgi:hypothetical protein